MLLSGLLIRAKRFVDYVGTVTIDLIRHLLLDLSFHYLGDDFLHDDLVLLGGVPALLRVFGG